MITLKDYQTRVLDSLKDFLRQCSQGQSFNASFQAIQLKNNRQPFPYISVYTAELKEDMPYVCLRVPTGGGKTLLACYASGLAMSELLRADRAEIGRASWRERV